MPSRLVVASMAAVALGAYFVILTALAMFGVHRLVLARAAVAAKRRPTLGARLPNEWPSVVVQLPMYNEALVAERAIRAAARLEYPPDRLEIQVLDDSTDATTSIVARVAEELSSEGKRVIVLRRKQRTGWKAGALREGLRATRAELVAIFDADFVPPADFLRVLVPELLAEPSCGLVQARWGHLNRKHSPLTRAQAVLLDAHFGIEHEGRAERGMCFNFNGTAGVWRRAAIEQAGGWTDDTITEDLDLSYRAQLAGWRFKYVDHLVVPGELPEGLAAFRSQQARWVRGSIETLKKHARTIALESGWSRLQKAEALVHLGGNLAYLLMAMLAFLLPLAVVVRHELHEAVPGGQGLLLGLDLLLLFSGTLAMAVFFWVSGRHAPPLVGETRLLDIALAFCVGAGLCLSNAKEVLMGLLSQGSEFVRTPKRGDTPTGQLLRHYRAPRGLVLASLEVGACGAYVGTIAYALNVGLIGAIPFLLLYAVGFGLVGGGSWREALSGARARLGRSLFTSDRRA